MTQSPLPKPELVKSIRCCDGWVNFYRHPSQTCQCEMKFSVYLPPQAEKGKVPILYWFSGLTCTEENFMAKAGAQRYAAKYGLMLVAPDTSPRGCNIEGEENDWDFGTGAGFYVNATTPKWSTHYRMYDYVTEELPGIIHQHFPGLADRQGVSGHSMGGHGALIVALKNPEKYRSISALAPICAPSQCPWGHKAFGNYLGEDQQKWAAYDASELVRSAEKKTHILIDQGTQDNFLDRELMPEILQKRCREVGYPLTLRMQAEYDHSYYFVATFIGEHIAYHARTLCI